MNADSLRPRSESELADMIGMALADGVSLEIIGGGTKRNVGRPVRAMRKIDMSGLSGIILYNPAELVMSAWAGTSLTEIEEELDRAGQMLAFEPMDYRSLLGSLGEPTIGGVFATNNSGPRRLTAGAARDSLLGVRFVNGLSETVKSGGRVMKNVTGLDLAKLMAGSWGTLGAISQVTFKARPKPQAVATILIVGLNDAQAAAAMATAMALPVGVSAAAHLPTSVINRFSEGMPKSEPITALRLEGLIESVALRAQKLTDAMTCYGHVTDLNAESSISLWREIRDCKPFTQQRHKPLWRISVMPSAGHRLVASLRLKIGVDAFYDWQGGLLWMAMEQDTEAKLIRQFICHLGGGHASLVRAPESIRAALDVFEPQPKPLAELSARIKASFDPKSIFNPGRMR